MQSLWEECWLWFRSTRVLEVLVRIRTAELSGAMLNTWNNAESVQKEMENNNTCESLGSTRDATSFVMRVRSFCWYVLNHLASRTFPCLFISRKKCICMINTCLPLTAAVGTSAP